MHIVLTWRPELGVDGNELANEVMLRITAANLVNGFAPFAGLALANVKPDRTRSDVDALVQDLRARAPGRFGFLLVLCPKGYPIGLSDAASAARVQAIVDFGR